MGYPPVVNHRAGQRGAASPILTAMMRPAIVITGLALWSASPAWTQTDARSAPSPGQFQTAEELLRALQADRPVSEVIEPASRRGKGPLSEEQSLLPEGTIVVERSGRLVSQAGGWNFQGDDGRTVTLLPNAQLESLLAMQSDASGPMSIVVSGEITLYANQNFLLVKHFSRGRPDEAESASDLPKEAPPVPSNASAEEVLSALQGQRPSLSSWTQRAERQPPISGGSVLLDGTLVVRRPGRLVHSVNRIAFEFEEEVPSCQKTVVLLPNQSLEVMTHAAEQGMSGLVFVVSGEMTQYSGENFLLVRGVSRQLQLGNLRP